MEKGKWGTGNGEQEMGKGKLEEGKWGKGVGNRK